MKKTLLLALALAVPTFAGEAPATSVSVVTPTTLKQAAAGPQIDLEVAAFYGFANDDIYRGRDSKEIDIYGADLTAVRLLDENNAVTLRFGYAFGDETDPGMRLLGCKHEIDVHTFSLMPGYRYSKALNENWAVYGGVSIGIANVSVKDHFRNNHDGYINGMHDSDWGFAYSAEIGLRYKLGENSELFAAYQLMGSSANPSPRMDYGDGEGEGFPVHQQSYNVVRVGFSYWF